jgi:hypothetical protein
MATTFKNFLSNDLANTRTLLHEAIPITGSIISGTYNDENVKEYGHGMFQSVYDYPFLSSSANHIFDITTGIAQGSPLSASTTTMMAKKANIYNQMAQTLVGYDTTGSIKKFTTSAGTEIQDAIFINFSRLLTKDEIKKGSVSMNFMTGGTSASLSHKVTVTDHSGANGYRVDSPAGEYGYLYKDASTDSTLEVGQIYYQAGVAVLSGGAVFREGAVAGGQGSDTINPGRWGAADSTQTTQTETATGSYEVFVTGAVLNELADGTRHRINNISFNNTTELNSSIYFCRVNHNDFNYSSNPTYLTGSKIRVKSRSSDAPVTYITTVGLYSADNELLAVAKLSEPLRKSSDTELTLRVRLDY